MSNDFIKPPKVQASSGRVGLSESYSVETGVLNYPVFCFRYLHRDYNFEKCKLADRRFLRGFVTKIKILSDLRWSDIQLTGRQQSGSEKIDRKSLNVPVPSFVTRDVGFLLSFYFSGTRGRIIGHRNGDIFHVIYIDTDLSVYGH